MAIQKTLTLSNHLVAQDAYIRIDTVAGYKGAISATANVYLSEAAFKGAAPFVKTEQRVDDTGATVPVVVADPQPFLEQISVEFAPDVSPGAANFIEQAYIALKGIERFAGAIDC